MSVLAFMLGASVSCVLWFSLLMWISVRAVPKIRRIEKQRDEAIDGWGRCAADFERSAERVNYVAKVAAKQMEHLAAERDHWRDRAQRAESMAGRWPH